MSVNSFYIDSIHNFTATVSDFDKQWSKVYILVDENTKEHCFPALFQAQDFFNDAEVIEIDSGEDSKSIEICYQIWGMMLETGADKNSLLVNLGGGVICDLGGFIGSTFKRGIDFINIPTTLLAQVDAGIGGKTGVNFEGVKNQIGLFSNPIFTYVDSTFTKTQDDREFVSGLAEVIKYGLITDKILFNRLTQNVNYKEELNDIISQCINIKNKITTQDFKDTGDRKKLNFGHTIGHAFESFFEGQLLHGEAVSVGIICESYISHETGGLKMNDLMLIKKTINSLFPKISFNESDFEQLLLLMKKDKKNENDQINFTLLTQIGEASINNYIKEDLIVRSLNYYLS